MIKEAFVTRGLDFQDRDPALLGNDYEDFFDGKTALHVHLNFRLKFQCMSFLHEIVLV